MIYCIIVNVFVIVVVSYLESRSYTRRPLQYQRYHINIKEILDEGERRERRVRIEEKKT